MESSSSTSSSDFSSSDESDLEIILNIREKPKNKNYIQETVQLYNETEFMEHFRLSRNVVDNLCAKFEESDFYKTQKGGYGKISALDHLLIFLWFAGHQTASFRDVADRFDVSISSLFNIIRRVTNFVSNLSGDIIKWPTNNEKIEIEAFFRENGFPGVIGIIDGSHIRIDKPNVDPDSYYNRKKYHSIQIQVVCDNTLKIRDVFIGYPGSVHDSRVLRTFPLFEDLPNKCGDKYLLGDSGYPCLRHLITPYPDRGQLTRRQRSFNSKLCRNRYFIEHCFGVLKQKFRQLYHIKLTKIADIVHFIRACCVLHNLGIEPANFEGNIFNEEVEIGNNYMNQEEEEEVFEDREGVEYRDFLLRNVII